MNSSGSHLTIAGWTLCVLGWLLPPKVAIAQTAPTPLPDLHLSKAGIVNTMVMQDDGQVVIGGVFSSVNGVPVTNLARLNRAGSVDGGWAPNPDGPVKVLVPSGTDLYVAGGFSVVAGQYRKGLARVNLLGSGTADAAWDPMPGGPVLAMALAGSNLYVGGSFTSIGGLSAANVARLSPTGNGGADPGWQPNPNGQVNTLLLNGSDVYLGGQFTQVGSLPRMRLAKLSTTGGAYLDSVWAPAVDAGVAAASPGSFVSGMVLNGTNLFVTGLFSNIAGANRACLAKLSATGTGNVHGWNPQPSTTNGSFALAVCGTNLFVGGQFSGMGNQPITGLARLALSGSGNADTNWRASVNSASVNTLLPSGNWLLVGGGFSLVNGGIHLGLAKLDPGSGLQDDQSDCSQVGVPGSVYALARQLDGKLIVGGDFWMSGQTARPNLARVNPDGQLDAAWAPAADGPVYALALAGTNVFVGGAFAAIRGLQLNGLAKVDTSGTDLVDPSWSPGTGPGAVVYALATDGAKLYVGGQNLGLGGRASISLGRVNAGAGGLADGGWVLPADGAVRTMALVQSNLFVGGEFTSIQSWFQAGLAKFPTAGGGAPDANWTVSADGFVYGLAALGTDLYVGGKFSAMSGLSRNGLAKVSALNPGAVDPDWAPALDLGWSPLSGQAMTLAVAASEVYVGGAFTNSAQVNLARLQPGGGGAVDAAWSPNPDGPVHALLGYGRSVLVGGTFASLGATASSRWGFAQLATADAPVIVQTGPSNCVVLPNPDNGPEITYFQITGIGGGTLRLNDGITPVNTGDFITADQGAAGLIFSGSSGSFSAVSALDNTLNGAGDSSSTLVFGAGQAPVFCFGSPAYAVSEAAGTVGVSVRKLGGGAGSVQFWTSDGTAAAGVNYVATNGVLVFGAAETNQSITVGIINHLTYEGDETFNLNLGSPGSGAALGAPATACVTIVDDNFIGPIGTYSASLPPQPPPPATAALVVVVQPPAAKGLWRLPGENLWHASGEAVGNRVTGVYRVEFQPLPGYRQPDTMLASLTAGTIAYVTNYYFAATNSGSGWITNQIAPAQVAGQNVLSLRGQWRVQGATNWLDGNALQTNVGAGWYGVEYKDITNWVTPPSQSVEVVDGEGSVVVGLYRLATEPQGTPPSVISYSNATLVPPYEYVGQVQTANGFGSGVVVKDRVVLTAGHLLFDDANLVYLSDATWLDQRYAGQFEPAPQKARGWQVFSGYAAQRQADNTLGIASPASQSQDLAAMYFYESAGRGGYGGYLVSGATNWLASSQPMLLAGYPMEVVAATNQGKPHATSPANLSFTAVAANVFSTTLIRGYPGLAGGPLEVLSSDGKYYPAGIYLGPTPSSTLVRLLDASAADLIDRADLSGNNRFSVPLPGLQAMGLVTPAVDLSATNGVSAGVSCTTCTGWIDLTTGPAEAYAAGARWYLVRSTDAPNLAPTLHSELAYKVLLNGAYTTTIKFLCVSGWGLPPNQGTVTVGAMGHKAIAMVYLPSPTTPKLGIVPQPASVTLWLSNGLTGYSYALDYRDTLEAGNPWQALVTNTLVAPAPVSFVAPATNAGRFYRARWVTCPNQ